MSLVALLAGIALAQPAPTTAPWGLGLGVDDAEAVQAWLVARDLSCAATPSPRRTTVRWDCGQVPAKTFPDREVGAGRIEDLLLAHLDDGPVHHLSSRRAHPTPDSARTDYAQTVARLTTQLGSPRASVPAPAAAAFTRPVVHASTRWAFDDLVVEATLVKDPVSGVRVTERWEVPGAAARAKAREEQQ